MSQSSHPADELTNRFAYHPATEVTAPVHEEVRTRCGELAQWIGENVPGGRHQSLALTALQESMMWCNAAIACDTPQGGETLADAPGR